MKHRMKLLVGALVVAVAMLIPTVSAAQCYDLKPTKVLGKTILDPPPLCGIDHPVRKIKEEVQEAIEKYIHSPAGSVEAP